MAGTTQRLGIQPKLVWQGFCGVLVAQVTEVGRKHMLNVFNRNHPETSMFAASFEHWMEAVGGGRRYFKDHRKEAIYPWAAHEEYYGPMAPLNEIKKRVVRRAKMLKAVRKPHHSK